MNLEIIMDFDIRYPVYYILLFILGGGYKI